MTILDPDPPVFEDPAVESGFTGTHADAKWVAAPAQRDAVPLWRHDLYGTPAWLFWAVCVALGLIAAVIVSRVI